MENIAAVKYGGRKKGTPNRLTKEVRTQMDSASLSKVFVTHIYQYATVCNTAFDSCITSLSFNYCIYKEPNYGVFR